MVDAVVADFGYVDLLVCNAGIASRGRSVADTDPDEMERVVRVHAFGAHHAAGSCCRRCGNARVATS